MPTSPASLASRRRPGGAFIVVVGPDGVGKTTVARALASAYQGPTAYFHFVPPIRRRMMSTPPDAALPHLGKGAPTGSRLLGCLRLLRNVIRFWAAYLATVRLAVARGTLVVGDRGAYGYLVQPAALKFYGPRRLAQTLIRALPHPDLVVNLSAPPEVIRLRKQELSLDQIERELEEWAAVTGNNGRLKTFDATEQPSAIAERILREI